MIIRGNLNNTQKTIRNSVISVIAQICTLMLQYFNRKIFILFLDIEYLGYPSLFGSVFNLLSVTELGLGGFFAYHLYKEITSKNDEEIGKLMYLHKCMYQIVACVVFIGGLICCFFLPFIVKDATVGWHYLYVIYFLQLLGVVSSFFFSYKRTLYIATQQEYKCVQVDLFIAVLIQIVQIVTLAVFKNFILYLCIQISSSVLSNIIISSRYDREFSNIKSKYTITKDYLKSRNMFSDFKNIIIHRISYAIYGGADNVIISAICGVKMVALYGNYYVIQKGIMQVFFYKLLDPVQATIGNILYSDRTKDELWDQFEMLDVFSFFFASYIGIGFYVLYQPFIIVWLGNDYLLSDMFVTLLSITTYLWAVWEIVYKYRNGFGDYKQDRWMMALSAVLNVSISIIGAKIWGVAGVQLGTLISFFPIAYGRVRFVVKNYFNHNIALYFLKHFGLFLIVSIEAVLCRMICDMFVVSILGLLERGLVILILPTVANCLIHSHNDHYRKLLHYLKGILKSYGLFGKGQ
ncbi:MAG: hypothetical protein IJ757_04975 [Clostridiales bacterium]|nr:hypothetical protein [Clostridiales bacterium]